LGGDVADAGAPFKPVFGLGGEVALALVLVFDFVFELSP
jgi:hypothetical protein